jgi:hypothetical protein
MILLTFSNKFICPQSGAFRGRKNFPSEEIFAHRRSSLVRQSSLADTMPARRANASKSAGLGTLNQWKM